MFNKLDKPFIENYIKGNATKEEMDTILQSLDDMNTALVVSMEDIDINKINDAIKETESTIESLGLNYGEKWLVYSVLNETYIDTIEKGIT